MVIFMTNVQNSSLFAIITGNGAAKGVASGAASGATSDGASDGNDAAEEAGVLRDKLLMLLLKSITSLYEINVHN